MRCCCGCPGAACSQCSGTPDKAVFLTTSGITPVASGTCSPINIPSGVNYASRFDYSAVQDYAACIGQDPGRSGDGCAYGINGSSVGSVLQDIFNPTATVETTPLANCPLPPSVTATSTFAYMKLVSGVYTLSIFSSPLATPRSLLYFLGTATIASPPCRISTPIVFSNTITAGNIYTFDAVESGPIVVSINGYAFASGGSAAVSFRKSCCP